MTDTVTTVDIGTHRDYEGSAEQLAGVVPVADQVLTSDEINQIPDAINDNAGLLQTAISNIAAIVGASVGVTLETLKSETDALSQVLSADDTDLDTAQERVDKIKQLLADVDTLAIVDIDGLQGALDGKEPIGSAQALVTALETTIRGSGAAGETLTSLRGEIDSLAGILSADDTDLDTAQERVDKIKQLLADVDTLAIVDIDGLQGVLDSLQASIADHETRLDSVQSDFDGLNLNAIAESKNISPVAVFIYDTRTDSDRGAWRHRCQSTSWYQEDLNTATRGARREFSSMPIVVAESSAVTLLDSDDPNQPMWKVYDFTGHTITSVSAKNGYLLIGSNLGLTVINLITDTTDFYDTSSVLSIVDNQVNDVDATVLDDAPVDHNTGLPIPTIAVATDGGISIIKHDGSVVDITGGISPYYNISFTQDNKIATQYAYTSELALFGVPDADTTISSAYIKRIYPASSTGGLGDPKGILGSAVNPVQGAIGLSIGTTGGLWHFHEAATVAQSMVAYITTLYNTGWMVGDIKGAYLASTDATNLVGAELVTNGDFDTDVIGWSSQNIAQVTHDSGKLKHETLDGSVNVWTYQHLTTVIGQSYQLSIDFDILSGYPQLRVGKNIGLSDYAVTSVDGPFIVDFVATTTQTTISAGGGTTSSELAIDNVSVRSTSIDRSHNGNGLTVNGTINRSAVSANSDLMAYSGFSDINYFEQPYNADLDFGTGDFHACGWLRNTGGNVAIMSRSIDGWVSGARIQVQLQLDGTISCFGISAHVQSTVAVTDGQLHKWDLVRKDGTKTLYIDGVENNSVADADNLDMPSAILLIGTQKIQSGGKLNGADQLLVKLSATAPAANQIAKMYHDERKLFDNPVTLYGTSDSVIDVDHDDVTGLTHAVTDQGRSVFDGLARVDNTTAAASLVAAHDGLVVEG